MQNAACENFPLSDLVRTFSVSFRLRPSYGNVDAEGQEIGCEVELIGQHNFTGKHVSGGCPHCLKVLGALLELSDLIPSGQKGPYRVGQIGARCEKLIRYASMAGDWPEVLLAVKIIRPPTFQQVPENCVSKLSDEIRTELRHVGCREIPFVSLPAESVAHRAVLLEEVAV
jgi:hypothetical protein